MNNYIVCDFGHSFLKIGYLNNENKLKVIYLNINEIEKLDKVLLKIPFIFSKIFIGVVDLKKIDIFFNWKEKNKLKVKIISINQKLFFDKINFNSFINKSEVGIDILSTLYYIEHYKLKNSLILNLGTAWVDIYYQEKFLGVNIIPNLLNSYGTLFDLTNLKLNLSKGISLIGINTNDALNNGFTKLINNYLEGILNSNLWIENLIFSGQCYQISKVIKIDKTNLKFLEIENIVLLGYFLLIKALRL